MPIITDPKLIQKEMAKLKKMQKAVQEYTNPYLNVIQTPSPSFNFIFGNTHGLPRGASMAFYGPPKSGKTLIFYAMVGEIHKNDPTAVCVLVDIEQRHQFQLTPLIIKAFGIDMDRLIIIQSNQAGPCFNPFISGEIVKSLQNGLNIVLVCFDSITAVQGRRTEGKGDIEVMQRGDQALTIQDGLGQMADTFRSHKVAVMLNCQIRAEQDLMEQKKGRKFKMAGGWAIKHYAEYFVSIEGLDTKAGRTSLDGTELVDTGVKDLMGKGEKIGHKIRVIMQNSSVGPKGRAGEFTLDYSKGIVNQFEEAYLLGTRRGVIAKAEKGHSLLVNNFPEQGKMISFRGKEDCLEALKTNDALRKVVVDRVREIDVDAWTNGRQQIVVNMTEDEGANSELGEVDLEETENAA